VSHKSRLFGTDGVRGVAGEKLTAELAVALGRATAAGSEGGRPQILIIRDTRESGPMLETGFAAGVAQGGGDAWLAGVLPTPAASVLVRRYGLDGAAVVSASHNPWPDNGIKLLGADGRKLGEGGEQRIEELAAAPPSGGAVGRVRDLEGALEDYLRELGSTFRLDLAGRRVALDCANGATCRAAPLAFQRLGADLVTMATEPDGRNINEGCGAVHPERLAEMVASSGAEIGFAFDGDGDRVIAVDGEGSVRDGDELIAACARHLLASGRLEGGVAVTVMSNYGFHRAMAEAGIEVATTPVGDKHVEAALSERGWTLGGEQSGHIIWTDHAPTGDGLAAALLVMQSLGSGGLAEAIPMTRLPQTLRSVPVGDPGALDGAAAIWDAVERSNAALESRGRVLLRPSGTEPVVRVMVESEDPSEAEEVCARLAELVERELGSE
jgi:phosphoglucosamine mutase